MNHAVLLMGHGAPASLDDVEEYVNHIRHGRPLGNEQMAVIKERYRLVGGSPLLGWTIRQAEALQARLQNAARVYVGMRHSRPFIHETVNQMRNDAVESFVAICLAPQFSNLTVGAYKTALDEAIQNSSLRYTLVRSFARNPRFIEACSQQLKSVLDLHRDAIPVFTAHSLPARILKEGDPYDYEAKETARLVANALNVRDWRFAYQSQGMTPEPWLGPKVESVIDGLAAKGCVKIVIDPIGFVSDNVEILYDIDVQFRDYAKGKGIELLRAPSLNDSPLFIELLSTLTRDHN